MVTRGQRRASVAAWTCVCAAVLLCGPSLALARPIPFPVPDAGAYIGGFVGSTDGLTAAFNTGADKHHAFFMRFIAVGSSAFAEGPNSAAQFAAECATQGAAPYFTLEPFHATSTSLLTSADVAWVEAFAREVGALHRPVFIRFGHEMNGNWYVWGWNHVSPSVYIAGFRQVSDIFRREAPQAAMIWAPSQNWGTSTDELYSNWYPGDDYVDWVGLTTYQWTYSGLSANQFADSISYGDGTEHDFYAAFAVGHDKPMIIAETACGDDAPGYYDNSGYGSSKDEVGTYGTAGAQQWWIHQVYSVGSGPNTVSTRFPRIKAISWFGVEDTKPGGADFQMGGSDPTSHSAGFEVYRAAVANPYWISAIPSSSVWTTFSADGSTSGWNNRAVTLTLAAHSSNAVLPLQTTYCLGSSRPATYTVPIVVSTQGTTDVSFHSQDAVGVREDTQTVRIRVDSMPPTTTVPGILGSYVSGAGSTISLSATDALSGVARTYWRTGGSGAYSQGVSAPVPTTVGSYTLRYCSADVAGNVEATRSATFQVVPRDSTPPTTVATPQPDDAFDAWVSTDVTITLAATDASNAIAWTGYSINGAAEQSGTVAVISAQGTTGFTYRSIDKAGNAETTETATVRIDRTAPVFSASVNGDNTGAASVNLWVGDSLSGVTSFTYMVDAGPQVLVPGLSATTAAVTSAGTHTVYYSATDAAGNRMSGSVSFTVAARPVPVSRATSTRISGPVRVRVGRTLRLTGRVWPSRVSGRVTITMARRIRGRWRSAGHVHVRVVGGRYRYLPRPRRRGTWRFVATYSGSVSEASIFRSSRSRAKYVTVR